MKKLLYIANIRLPTEKAHGLQIMQNCEAFADAGVEVVLWAARRVNTPQMQAIGDAWDFYGVNCNFTVSRIPTLDLLWLMGGIGVLVRLAFYLQLFTFTFFMLIRALFTPADVYYSRDPLVLLALSFIKKRQALVYESHQFAPTPRGQALQRRVVRRVGSVVTITPTLRHDLISLGADPERVLTAHDGIRAARFAGMPEKSAAREEIGWPADAYIVGYVGRLHTMAMDKGVGVLIKALKGIDGAALALVGGPDEMAAELRERWLSLGLDEARFLYAGQVSPDAVPRYLSAFDVCAMPHPFTKQFAYYTSPLKLFEYMAARRAVTASDLPGWADVVADGETALLVPPGDVDALAAALLRLRDANLRERLADAAYERVMTHYTWAARAQAILAHVEGVKPPGVLNSRT